MRNSGNKNLIRIAAFLKRNVISLLIVIFAAMTLITVTSAWLKRADLVNKVYGVGFRYKSNIEIMEMQYSVKTYYKKPDGKWQLITQDYVREEDQTIDWTEHWDEMSAVMAPGKRTEFRTEIKNLTGHEQQASVHLADASVEKELLGKITIGASEPEVLVHRSTNEEIFREFTDSDGIDWVTAETLCLAPEIVIPAGETVTVKWYVSLEADVDYGAFPILTDMEDEPVRAPNDDYYSVNETDDDGNVTEAFQCDEFGVLRVYNGKLIPYPGDYSEVKCDNFTIGASPYRVRLSGMYIAVG